MNTPSRDTRRHLFVIGFFSAAFLVVVTVSTLMIWPRIIAKRVQAFCDSVEVASTVQGIPDRARTFRLKSKLFPPYSIDKNKKESVIQSSDGVAFDRYFCTIESLDGIITSKRFSN